MQTKSAQDLLKAMFLYQPNRVASDSEFLVELRGWRHPARQLTSRSINSFNSLTLPSQADIGRGGLAAPG